MIRIKWKYWRPFIVLSAPVFILTGCRGIQTGGEQKARDDIKSLSRSYPSERKNILPVLDRNATLNTYLRFAMLNQPRVEDAYYEYAASIEDITLGRSLPDPYTSFQINALKVSDWVTGGLAIDMPWPSKLTARANIATEESNAKYHAFELAVLQTAIDVKRPYYQLHFLQDRISITKEMLELLKRIEESARVRNEAGKATLQDVLRSQIEQQKIKTDLSNLEDSRNPLMMDFKAALGLKYEQETPPVPVKFDSPSLDLSSEQLFKLVMKNNPQLKQIEAEVRAADEGINLARKSMLPDFSTGAESGLMFGSVMLLPKLDVSLPIWRDKIAAEISSAQARKKSASAKLTSEQIQLAVDFAEKTYMYREGRRNLDLLTGPGGLIDKAKLSLDVATVSYSSGNTDFNSLIDAERTLLGFKLTELDAKLQCELALAEISLIIGEKPASAPSINKETEKP